jgi:hypothetical protein
MSAGVDVFDKTLQTTHIRAIWHDDTNAPDVRDRPEHYHARNSAARRGAS